MAKLNALVCSEFRRTALKLSAVLASAALAGVTSAFAVEPNFVATVTATPPTVIQGTFVGYSVKITNNKPNPITGVRLIGTTNVTAAEFVSSSGATCTTTTSTNSIECVIGSLAPGDASSALFSVTFKAPSSGAAVIFTWSSVFDESGAGGSDGVAGVTPAGLSAPLPDLVVSHVPAAAGDLSFFTGGNGGIPNSADQSATKVTVPNVASARTAKISEAPFSVGCTNFITCYESTITIEGIFSPYLTIVLRQDKSNIKKGTRIESVLIDYVDVDPDTLVETVYSNIGDCASETTPPANASDGPCIAKRVSYKNKRVPGWTTELDGDFEWTILHLKNGRYPVY